MHPLDRPRLRPFLKPLPLDQGLGSILLYDRLHLSPQVRFTRDEYQWVSRFDGLKSLREIHQESAQQPGHRASLDWFVELADRLERDLLLDGPRYQGIVQGPTRPPGCLEVYESHPAGLRRQLERLFTGPGGPGLPSQKCPDGQLRGALVPHIDYHRGGVSYGWGFKEIVERTQASLFVILATSHYSSRRFSLTRKNFQTPLGIVPTDQGYIDRLVRRFGSGLFEDELLAHFPEHSVELEVVLLQYLYENRRPIRMVPLVVGSFQDCVWLRNEPDARADIGQMIQALREVEKETPEPICYLISGDLAHIGPKFGDARPVLSEQLFRSKQRDQALLHRAENADAAGYFRLIAAENDERNICGLPPTYLFLEAFAPRRGRLLYYDQYVHPAGQESVSFASMGFYK